MEIKRYYKVIIFVILLIVLLFFFLGCYVRKENKNLKVRIVFFFNIIYV